MTTLPPSVAPDPAPDPAPDGEAVREAAHTLDVSLRRAHPNPLRPWFAVAVRERPAGGRPAGVIVYHDGTDRVFLRDLPAHVGVVVGGRECRVPVWPVKMGRPRIGGAP
jgi:hypothetical protein